MIKLQFPKSYMIRHDELLTATRPGRTDYVDGKPLARAEVTYQFHCNVQPINGRDLLLVPEGDRYKEQYTVWTEHPVQANDRIIRCDISFQAQSVEAWGTYFKVRMMRLDVGPRANP